MPVSDSQPTARVTFKPGGASADVERGANLLDAALAVGVEVPAPCGGLGRCGRCRVKITEGDVDRRSAARLTPDEQAAGHALACQSFVTGNVTVEVPKSEKHRVSRPRDEVLAGPTTLPAACSWKDSPCIRTFDVVLEPPSLEDNTSDLDRLRTALTRDHGLDDDPGIDLPVLQHLGRVLRESGWHVAVAVEMANYINVPPAPPRIVAVMPHDHPSGTYGVAVDVGTTSVILYLVDFATAEVIASASAYNDQISCGDDVIARIVYAKRDGGLERLQGLVTGTINALVAETTTKSHVRPTDIHEIVVAGNTTMVHLLLGLDPRYIREDPYTPTVSFPAQVTAADLGIAVNPHAGVRCMPAVGSYVGGDITSGVMSSGMYASEDLVLFIDIGTNGEMVLGNKDWLISCACSAGPAFEGGGVASGMRAVSGAIEDVWIDPHTFEPTIQTIDDEAPLGLCGSGLIDLLGELFITGVVDKSGHVDTGLRTDRVRSGGHGGEYVVAWADETGNGKDVVLTEADIDNLLRAKAAIYAGFMLLCSSVGVELAAVDRILIGGAFGQYLDPAKAIQIGLLPDMPADKVEFLGNTSVLGAFTTLLCTTMRQQVIDVASKMTYLELSADNSFMDAYTSALFLPHTDLEAFPTVKALLEAEKTARSSAGAAPGAPAHPSDTHAPSQKEGSS
jgi:uncharacterized 2Fe-2S/4Fe-4S cluster protein (DUF4445 family)